MRLLDRLDPLNHGVEIRPIAGLELGVEELAISLNFECAAARGNQGQRFDALTEFENLGRQTDGLGRVVSNYTVFNRDFGFHRAPFQTNRLSVGEEGSSQVKEGCIQAALANCLDS